MYYLKKTTYWHFKNDNCYNSVVSKLINGDDVIYESLKYFKEYVSSNGSSPKKKTFIKEEISLRKLLVTQTTTYRFQTKKNFEKEMFIICGRDIQLKKRLKGIGIVAKCAVRKSYDVTTDIEIDL